MVKIPDLTDKQLLAQIQKYEKIQDQLKKERDKRAAANPSDELYTKKELVEREVARQLAASQAPAPAASAAGAPAQAAAPAAAAQDNFLSFDDEELTAMEAESNKAQEKAQEDDEEVRVTQLLQLSKEDLAALQANKKKIQKKG